VHGSTPTPMRLFFFPIICFFILGHRTLSSLSTPSWEATSSWPPPPLPCIAMAHTHTPHERRTHTTRATHMHHTSARPQRQCRTAVGQGRFLRRWGQPARAKWRCEEEVATFGLPRGTAERKLRRFLAKRPCGRGSTAWRSPTMAAAEPLAAVECVCPLLDPCVRASKEERKAEGTVAQFTP
jgi:hypothetical protein